MAMGDKQRLRLYLRDSRTQDEDPFFTDAEIEELISATASIEEATGLGWLLKAANAADAVTTQTIGQVSETRAQATESYKICITMHHHWMNKAGVGKATAEWFEAQPDTGLIADLMDTAEAIRDYWVENDISRLDPIV